MQTTVGEDIQAKTYNQIKNGARIYGQVSGICSRVPSPVWNRIYFLLLKNLMSNFAIQWEI